MLLVCKACGEQFEVVAGHDEFCSVKCRLPSKLVPRGGPECWVYTGAVTRDGYGKISYRVNGKRRFDLAHRVAYLRWVGPIPEGLCVLHTCDNPPCCNPEHLFLGTQLDNVVDRDKKGRQAKGDTQGLRVHPEKASRGELNGGGRKLKDYHVRAIRYVYPVYNQREISEIFGVSQVMVGKILRRELWKHVY